MSTLLAQKAQNSLTTGSEDFLVGELESTSMEKLKGFVNRSPPRAHHPCFAHGVSLAWKTNSWVRVSRRAASTPTSRGNSVFGSERKGCYEPHSGQEQRLTPTFHSETGGKGRGSPTKPVSSHQPFLGQSEHRIVPVLLPTELMARGKPKSPSKSHHPVTKISCFTEEGFQGPAPA